MNKIMLIKSSSEESIHRPEAHRLLLQPSMLENLKDNASCIDSSDLESDENIEYNNINNMPDSISQKNVEIGTALSNSVENQNTSNDEPIHALLQMNVEIETAPSNFAGNQDNFTDEPIHTLLTEVCTDEPTNTLLNVVDSEERNVMLLNDAQTPEITDVALPITPFVTIPTVQEYSHYFSGKDFKGDLARWAVLTKNSHSNIRPLLYMMRLYKIDVPLDPRTLLKTPRTTEIKKCQYGEYKHFGLMDSLKNIIDKNKDIELPDILNLGVGIDDIPTYKGISLTVILGCIDEIGEVFIIGMIFQLH